MTGVRLETDLMWQCGNPVVDGDVASEEEEVTLTRSTGSRRPVTRNQTQGTQHIGLGALTFTLSAGRSSEDSATAKASLNSTMERNKHEKIYCRTSRVCRTSKRRCK